MDSNFPQALKWVLLSEGGFVENPHDPGGATNRGVTQSVYAAWCRQQGLPIKSVRGISDAEVASIYRAQYWSAAHCGELPSGVDYATFDLAVNSGPVVAVQFLQRAVGTTPDGHFGILTRAALGRNRAQDVITRDCAARLSWLQQLRNWKWFGRGWTNRVAFVKAHAMQLAGSVPA